MSPAPAAARRPGEVLLAGVAGHFGRDVERSLTKAEAVCASAAEAGVSLLALPDATVGGYVDDLVDPLRSGDLPPAVDVDGPEVARLAAAAGDVVLCFGIAERAVEGGEEVRYNTAVCVHRGEVLGTHRKVHLPLGEFQAYRAGDRFAAVDTPVGRVGLLVDFDKSFPESGRALALDGAEVLVCLSAWPASATDRAERLRLDRQARLFDIYDAARAAENQVWLVSANQTGRQGRLHFLGQAKVVDPSGDVVARTWSQGGMASAVADVSGGVAQARRRVHHLRDRVLGAYGDRVGQPYDDGSTPAVAARPRAVAGPSSPGRWPSASR
ncbi:carbon-nitrogen hydrolase family protein [Pseudokineococcus sp. 1T1Z-3]|uniref:carbon-nitrogen hydrolase family protein n=1 Tax=Pseudokineococcus sp. 1T1Z-3 TaxID=3132745 RepID=UPI0030B26ED6